MPTFFRGDSTVRPALDLETQAQHALQLFAAGITGLVLAGSTGEAISLDEDERTRLIQHVRQARDEAGFAHRALIAGTTAQDLYGVRDQLRAAREAGAGYGLVLAPGFFAGGFGGAKPDGVAAWFEAIADISPMPILAYSFPAVSNGLVLSSDTLVRLAQHPRIVGCKLSHGDMALHARIAGHRVANEGQFAVFTGMASQLLPVLSVGCAGAIDGLAAAFPRAVVAVYEEFHATRPDRSRMGALQYEIAVAYEAVGKLGIAGFKRVVEQRLEYRTGGTRLPLQDKIDAETWGQSEPAILPLANREQSIKQGCS